MTSPNRRPGVDADIVQATMVRGYDAPAAAVPPQQPEDLIIATGQDQASGVVADILLWNRTNDQQQPMFVMRPGSTLLAAPEFQVFAGTLATPNGVVTAEAGALYVSNNPPSFWQNQDGATSWQAISDVLGGESLAETLAIGNVTGGNDIVVTNGDLIVGQANSLASGFNVTVQGGPAVGLVGNGGSAILMGGFAAAGASGGVQLLSQTPTGTNSSGDILLSSASTATGGSSGGINLITGTTGAPGIGGSPGWITAFGGLALTTGSAIRGGSLRMEAGRAVTAGEGGFVRIVAGDSSNGAVAPVFLAPVAGQGGTVLLRGGASSLDRPGGAITITAGAGGSAGATGGNINLTPGAGGGGFDNGQIIGNGIFRSDNIQRGDGDPNVLALAGNEGDVYQRTTAGLGQLWLNSNGTPTGWVRLAFSGDFIDSFQQLNFGYFSRAGQNPGGLPEDEYADVGILEGLAPNLNGAGAVAAGGGLPGGPYVAFTCTNNGDRAALDMSTGAVSLPHSLQQQFIGTFRMRNTVLSDQRIFVGFSSLSATNQLASALPGGGSYIGFLLDSAVGGNWRVITSNGVGITGPIDTGVSPLTTSSGDGYFFVIDGVDGALPVVRFYILDPDLNLIANISVPSTIPSTGTVMGTVMGISKIGAPAGQKSLQVITASVVNDASVVGQGGGAGLGNLSLAQVLINGNETGGNPILINQGSSIQGVVDDNAGDGADLTIVSGGTTLAASATGDVLLSSASHTVAAGTGDTGAVALISGFQTNAAATGDTGSVTLASGAHVGTGGSTGNVIIASGVHSGGVGGTVGNVNIAPGTFAPNAANPGNLELRGGSTSLVGVTAGDVIIRSGQQSAATGNTGDATFATYDAALNGNSGSLFIATGRAGNVSGASGNLDIRTGQSPAGDSGNLIIATGDGLGLGAGNLTIGCGISTVGAAASLQIVGGDALAGGQSGGNISLTPGTGPAGDGEVIINGKLTVTGLIDPTGLLLDGQNAAPIVPAVNQGLLWINQTVSPSQLIYTDDTGSDHNISTGGGATALGDLTDVTLTAPVAGQVLTYNGVDWVNLAGAGGSPLATILGIGNTTGGLPIVVSTGDRIVGQTHLQLDPGAAVGNRVIIDGSRWPEGVGVAGYTLTTDGAGELSWAPGGGGGTETFAEAFARMQWGAANARITGSPFLVGNGIFDTIQAFSGGASSSSTNEGIVASYPTLAVVNNDAGVQAITSNVRLDSQFLSVFHIDTTSPVVDMRFFAGVTTGTVNTQVVSVAPAERYVGLELITDAVPAQATFRFVTDNATGTPTLIDTGVSPGDSAGFWLTIDASVSGDVTLTLYDRNRVELATTTFSANLPTATTPLGHVVAVRSLDGLIKTASVWSMATVTRADLLGAIGGGGGSQNLASVLSIGAETGGVPIQGDDNGAGSGGDLELLGGSSTGGGGSGGDIVLQGGSPAGGGNGTGGGVSITTAAGVGTGDGGNIQINTGVGGPTSGDGGTLIFAMGAGAGPGAGGSIILSPGDGGATSGAAGSFEVHTGSATGGNGVGGEIDLSCGDSSGTADGNDILLNAGGGGGVSGDGGDVVITVGSGGGTGVDGEIICNGDTTINGKLTVTGLIDPTGLLMTSQPALPFTATGNDGGIWVNNAGELIYTNSIGDLNLSTAIGGGLTFLEAMNLVSYGWLGAGNTATFPQSNGVYGGSVDVFVSPGPPPASITFSTDVEGPTLSLATGALANSNAWVSTDQALIRRDQLFRAVFKFQSTSPSHDNERLFIGFTADPTLQLGADDPAIQYVGIRQNHLGAVAHNLEFVARGSGGAMVATLAVPTDTDVHYLVISAISATEVVFTLLADDGVTVEATHTEPQSTLLPSLTTALFPFTGIRSNTGATPRGIDFYFTSVVVRADIVDAVTGGGGGGGVAPLSTVLNTGNTTGAQNIVFSSTTPLGILSESGTANTSTAGTNLTIRTGSGSTETGTAAAGGAGGTLAIDGGNAGATDAVAAAGGAGGAVNINSGDGGANTGGFTAGAGGAFLAAAGPGGAASGGLGAAGGGGAASLLAGTGGTSLGGAGGAGGAVTITAGAGGAGVAGSALGGNVSISAGASTTGTGGNLNLSSGIGATSGGVSLTASNSINGLGSIVNIRSGNGGTSGGGGRIINTTGNGAGNTNGGAFQVNTGTGAGTGNGGNVEFELGNGGATAGDGGNFIVNSGDGVGGGPGGNIQLAAGNGQGAGTGGLVLIEGGDGGATNAAGGDMAMRGGSGGGTATGGTVELTGGTGGATAGDGGECLIAGGNAGGAGGSGGTLVLDGGSGIAPGSDGQIHIRGGIVADGDGLKIGTDTGNAGQGPFAIVFGSAFAATPRCIQLTLESAQAAASPRVVPGTLATTGFSFNTTAPIIAGDVLYWTVWL